MLFVELCHYTDTQDLINTQRDGPKRFYHVEILNVKRGGMEKKMLGFKRLRLH
jgi:hypothetical protein